MTVLGEIREKEKKSEKNVCSGSLSSGAAPATVVGVPIEVPVMPMLVTICLKTTHWFDGAARKPEEVVP
jgi:hypothetical protein